MPRLRERLVLEEILFDDFSADVVFQWYCANESVLGGPVGGCAGVSNCVVRDGTHLWWTCWLQSTVGQC